MDHHTGGRSHSLARVAAGKNPDVYLRPRRPRLQRNRLAQAALHLLDNVADQAPLFCGCEEVGCPSCD